MAKITFDVAGARLQECENCKGRGYVDGGDVPVYTRGEHARMEPTDMECPDCHGSGEVPSRLDELEEEIIDQARNYRFQVNAAHHWDGTGKRPDLAKARQWLFDAVDEYEAELL